jgi:hypothetical protein
MIIYHLSLKSSKIIEVIIYMRKIFEILKINLLLSIRKIELFYGEEFCLKNEIYFTNINNF